MSQALWFIAFHCQGEDPVYPLAPGASLLPPVEPNPYPPHSRLFPGFRPLCYNFPVTSSPPSERRPARSFPADPWAYALSASFLTLVLLSLHFINDSDLGFHLAGGRWILENHRFPSQDTYTYTVAGRPYLDIHWLYQVALYLFYRLGGYTLLSLVHSGLILAAFILAWKRVRLTGAPVWMGVLLLAAAIGASEIRFRARPEVASWFLMGLTLWVLDQRLYRKRNLLFLLPPLQLVWVNTEGLFVLGWGLMAFYWLSGYWHSGKPDPKLLRYSLGAVACGLVNPNFFRGLLYPFSHLAMLSTANVFKYTVQELEPPWALPVATDFAFFSYLLIYKLFSLFLLVLLLATFRRRKLHEWLLALAFFGLSVSALRNVPLFLMACLPVAASAWNDLGWDRLRKFQSAFLARPFFAWVMAALLSGASLQVTTNAHYVSGRRTDRFGVGLALRELPVRACRFLAENHLDGRIVNQLDSGGWLDWQGPPGRTFVDGRLEVMGRDFYTEYMESMSPGGLARLAAKYRADILFFKPTHAPQWILDLTHMPDWRLVYLDETAAVYLRKGYAETVPRLEEDRLWEERGVPKDILGQAPGLLQAPPPPAWQCFWEDFGKPSAYSSGLLDLGIFCTYDGRPRAAEAFFLEDIRRTRGRYADLFYNLGCLYDYQHRYPEALACMKRVLEAAPRNAFARQVTGKLSNSVP